MLGKQLIVSFLLLPLSFTAFAQNAPQSLNDDLIAAAKKGDEAAVKALIAKGANVNARTNYGATALHFAADRGHLEVVKALVEAGADVNAKDEFYKSTPIMMAIMRKQKEVIGYLQQIAKPKNNPDATASAQAVTTQPAAKPANPEFNEQILDAAKKGDVATIKSLLAKGADVNAKSPYGATPLFFACDRGNAEVVKTLLDAGADVNVKDTFYKSTPISWAVQRDHAEVVKLLVEKSSESKESTTAQAVMQGQVKTAKALLEMGGIKPESLTQWLTMSEKSGDTEIVELLKKAGARPKPKTEFKIEPTQLKRYEGSFKNDELELSFTVKDGKLIGTVNGFDLTLNPIAEHAFEIEGRPSTATFKLEGDKAVSLMLKRPSGETTLKRVEAK